jgi:O-antigen/teichoic acid export membrane protein
MPGLASRLKRNSILSLLSSGTRLLANSLMFIGIARFYGPAVFGSFSAAYILASIFVVVADFGFDNLLTIEVARSPDRVAEPVREYFSIKLLFCLFGLAAIWSLPLVERLSPVTEILLFLLSFSVIFTSLTNFFFALFKGIEQFQHELRITSIVNVVLLIVLVAIGFFKLSFFYVGLAFVATRALGLLLAVIKARNLLELSPFHFTLKGWSKRWRLILTFGFSLLFGNLFFQLITPLLVFFRGDYAAGIYESVFKLVGLISIISDIGVNAILPALSRFHVENFDRWITLNRLFNRTLFLVSLPIALVFLVYPRQIIDLLYGVDNFGEAVGIMRIAAVVILVRFASETYGLMLTTSDRQNARMRITMAGTVLSVLFCWYFIPRYGSFGAGLAALSVNACVGLGYMIAARPYVWRWMWEKYHLLPATLALVLGAILYLVGDRFWILTMCGTVLTYGVLSYFLGYTRYERELMLGIGKQV